MSTKKTPNNSKQWVQSNNGDYEGNLWETFNIDLDSNPGTLKVSKKLQQILGDTELLSDVVQALNIHDGNYYLATTNQLFKCSVNNDPTTGSNWTTVADFTSTETDFTTDMTSFGGLLLVSYDTNISSWDGTIQNSSWGTAVAGFSSIDSNYVHTMDVLRTGNDTLFYTNGDEVKYYNAAAGAASIALDANMVANCLTPSLDRMWCGAYTEVEDSGYVYELRVGDTSAFQAYEIEGRVALSMFTYRNTPFVITELGYIQVYNGAGFETIAQFPWATQSRVLEGCRPGLVQDTPSGKGIVPKGVKVRGQYAYILVQNQDEYGEGDNLIGERSPSGIWVLDLQSYSLTHRYSFSNGSNDYGWMKISRPGPILVTNTPETRILAGAEIGITNEGLWGEGTEEPQGSVTLTRHESDSIADTFEKFVTKIDTLSGTNAIKYKYRTTVDPTTPLLVRDITWLDETTFTTTDQSITTAMEGYEVAIEAGYASGNFPHITNVETGTTVTVTVDESIGLLNETSDIRVNNWQRIDDNFVAEDGEHKDIGGVDGVHPFAQFRAVLTGNITVREFISKSNSKEEL